MGQGIGNMIQIGGAAVGIIATFFIAIAAIYKIRKSQKYKYATYYVARGAFADREKSLEGLLGLISSESKIINVFGKRGVGKSSFLRFFSDFMNKQLKGENSKRETIRHGIKKPFGRAFYIEISSYGNQTIESQILSQMADRRCTLAELAEQTARRLKWSRRIFIIIDNINNDALGRELEAIVDVFLSRSKKYIIVVGSVEKQPFLNMVNEKRINFIELEAFEERDVFEFASRNKILVPREYISKVIDFSDGLPIFVSLLLTNNTNELSLISHMDGRIESYLSRIIEDLDSENIKLAQYIGFLSVTNATISIQTLKQFRCLSEMSNLESLENSALIEIDREKNMVKMHELFRNHICKRYMKFSEIIEDVYQYCTVQGMEFEQIYYLIMLDISDREKVIIEAIEKSVRNEKYSFLLLFGEHYKRIYDLKHLSAGLSRETFLYIIYGYVEGLIGVGDYPAAREIIDRCKISAREPDSKIQFIFSLMTAQLYHLQNDYGEAIATYHLLLEYIKANSLFREYESKCFWGIAHSLRHEGYNLDMAIEYYQKSIASAKKLKSESEVIRGMREELFIYMFKGIKNKAKRLHTSIKKRIDKLPENSYTSTRIAFLKSTAIYQRTILRDDPEYEYKLLESALENYTSNKKRLQYNIFFEFGECRRRMGQYIIAAENYQKALSFSRRNKDHNLETLSQIALIINDICSGSSREDTYARYKAASIQSYSDSVEYNLHINKLLADLVISYLNDTGVDGETFNELKRVGYYSAVNLCHSFEVKHFKALDLFLT